MASNIFNSYAGGNGSYTTTYNKIQTLNDDLQNSLIFDTKRHSIWAKGEEYGYSNAIFINDNGSNGNFINGVSISYDKNAYTITYNKGYAFDTLSGTKGDNNLVSNITASNGTITITYIKSTDLSASYSNTAGDADTLDGSHKNELLTNVSLTADGNNTKVSVTVGGTEKNSSLTVPYASDAGTLNGHAGTYFANKIELTGDITSSETTVSSYKLSVSTTHYVPSTATATTGTGATSFIASNGFNDENAHYLRDGISILNGLKLDAKKHVVGTYEVTIKETYPTELTNTNVASNNEFGRKITLTTNYNDSYSTVIPFATNTSAGVLKTYSAALNSTPETYLTTTEGRYYASRLNSDNKLITNVPWENFWTYKVGVTNNSGSKLTFTYHKYVGSAYTDSTFDVTIPIADASNFGVVKSGSTSNKDYGVSVNSSTGAMTVSVNWENFWSYKTSGASGDAGYTTTFTYHRYSGTSYTDSTFTSLITPATTSAYGVVKLGDSTQRDITASKVYGIAVNSSGQLCVNVPWTDNDRYASSSEWSDVNGGKQLTITYSGTTSGNFTSTLSVMTLNSYGVAKAGTNSTSPSAVTGIGLGVGVESSSGRLFVNNEQMSNTTFGVAKAYYSVTSAVNVNSVSSTTGRYYGVQTNPDGKLIVNVPWTSGSTFTWTDTNNTYNIGLFNSDTNYTYKSSLSFNPYFGHLHIQGTLDDDYDTSDLEDTPFYDIGSPYNGGIISFGDTEDLDGLETYIGEIQDQRIDIYGRYGINLFCNNDSSSTVNFQKTSSHSTILNPIGHGSETNYIDQISVVSTPGSDTHTLYVVI